MIKVTAAILFLDGKVLIAQRRPQDPHAHRWEFPGGKIEGRESPRACLARELQEELGIEVRVGAYLGASRHRYDHIAIELLAFRTHWTGGALTPREHQALAWVAPAELDRYDFTPADLPFVRQLQSGRIAPAG